MDLVAHAQEFAHVYKEGVLQPKRDYQLVMGLEGFARKAGIPPHYIYKTIYDFMDNGAADWMQRYYEHGKDGNYGYCFVGTEGVLEKMSAMVGCAIRNYINARMMTVQDLLKRLEKDEAVDDALIAIPDFFMSASEGGDVPKWKSSMLLSWMYERYSMGRFTIVYVSSIQSLASGYGTAFKKFIMDYMELSK